MKGNNSIQVLKLHKCGLSEQGILGLMRGLKQNTSLRSLGLGGNNFIDPLATRYIADALVKRKGRVGL